MIEMFIAVFLVMAVMTLFLFRVIQKCVARLNAKVKEEFLASLQVYDEQIEARSKKLKEIKRQIHETEARRSEPEETGKVSVPPAAPAQVIENNADYVDSRFFEDYALIQNEFRDGAFEAMKDKLQELMSLDTHDPELPEYQGLKELFDCSLQYEMMTLSPADQLSVMETVAESSPGRRRILEEYCDAHSTFDIREFMAHVSDHISRNDTQIHVYSRSGEPVFLDLPKNVVFEQDASIAEGYRIRYRDRVYDYSL